MKGMKKALVGLTVILTTVAAFGIMQSVALRDAQETLRVANVANEATIADYEVTLASAQASLATAQALVAADEAVLAATQTTLASTRASLAAKETALATTQASGAASAVQVATLTAAVATLNAQVASLQAAVTTLNAQVATQTAVLAASQAKLATAQAALTTSQADLAAAQAQLDTLPKDVTYAQVVAFVAGDTTHLNTYSTFSLFNYPADMITNANKQHIRTGVVAIYVSSDLVCAIVAFNTTDKGLVYIDPENNEQLNLHIGLVYYGYTVLSFITIW